MSLSDFLNRDRWDGRFEVTECRRALHPSGLPGIDFALNPYGGCEHGCRYCYAPEVTHSDWDSWRVVRVRANIADRLSKEIPGLTGVIGIGTVTDPYQGAEARFELTLSCLQVISGSGMGVHIHTKSDLVTRDADIIASIPHTIGITVTTPDDSVSKRTEPGAPLPGRRFEAMRTLCDAGLDVYALVGPVMSSLEGRERELAELICSTGVRKAVIDRLNLRPMLQDRLSRMGIGASEKAVYAVKRCLEERGITVIDAFPNRSRNVSDASHLR